MSIELKIIHVFRSQIFEALLALEFGRRERYTIEQCVAVLDELDYRVNEDLIRAWQERRILPPGDNWTEQEILAALCALEVRRCWKSYPSKHDMKKSRTRIDRERLPHNQVKQIIDEVAAYDTWLLLAMITSCDDQAGREQIYEILIGRLDVLTGEFRKEDAETWRDS
jgi:hypothetical protein